MKTKIPFVGMVLTLVLSTLTFVQAKDEVRVTYPSKVESSKGKEREKLFGPWMSSADLVKQTQEKRGKGEQLIYFEYDGAKDQQRAIYTNKVKLTGPYSHWVYLSEPAMEEKLSSEVKRGLEPAFIVRNPNGSTALLMVSPGDLVAVRAELKLLGIGEPKLKK